MLTVILDICQKEYGFYNLLKVEEYYELFLSLYKVGGRYRSRRIEEVLEMIEMTQYKQTFIGELPIELFHFYIWERQSCRNRNGS